MATHPHNNASNKVKPWPAYFIVRTSGEVVPLIGVDELPIGVDLVGVPRNLNLNDTSGMLNLGIQRSSEAFYRIAKQDKESTSKIPTSTESAIATPKSVAPPQPKPACRPATIPSALRSTTSRPFQETQTCRHWCTHGHCKWGQQCRYRHTMPLTVSGLLEIGLSDWPSWFRSLNPGYFTGEPAHPKTHLGRRTRGSQGRAHHGGCGDGCKGGADLGVTHARAEQLRSAGVGEKSGRRMERLVADLREDKIKEGLKSREKEKQRGISGTVSLERASMRDAKKWEDEGSENSDETGEAVGEENEGRTSLLD